MDDIDDPKLRYLERLRQMGPLPAPREVFDAWRSPREGTENPTRMDNPVWAWLVRNRLQAYDIVQAYGASSALDHGPTWCFERFGQSETLLPDGRRLYIGGEHEDHYDPDFHIYNDVVAVMPDGEVAIHGYPRAVFPPTDFHTASLVGTDVYIVGRLGYPEDRRERIASVHVLDTNRYRIRELPTTGDAPPWLHDHEAVVDSDGTRIHIQGGKVIQEQVPVAIANLDRWELRLPDGVWTRTLRSTWPRWCVTRAVPGNNALWFIRRMLWRRSVRWLEDEQRDRARLEDWLGPGADPERITSLYVPPLPHQAVPPRDDDEGAYNTTRIEVDGVLVRYDEDSGGVMVTIEGDLPQRVQQVLVDDLRTKLEAVEGHGYRVLPVHVD